MMIAWAINRLLGVRGSHFALLSKQSCPSQKFCFYCKRAKVVIIRQAEELISKKRLI